MLIQLVDPTQTQDNQASTGIAVGIDLGTTHSVVAFAEGGRARVLPGKGGLGIVPSIVAYQGGAAIVGERARSIEDAISSVKRLIGRREVPAELQGRYPFDTTATGVHFRVENRKLTPIEISADILKALKTQAEEALGQTITKAVITVPAYFDEAARQETKEAARIAGLEILRLINEPTAAALAYGLDQEVEGTYAVYDFGGGTFDISIIKFTRGVFQVIATAGDTLLGGDDIDRALCLELGLDENDPRGRQIKEYLSIHEKYAQDGLLCDTYVLAGAAGPLIHRTLEICKAALRDAGLATGDLTGVILVGGSTRMPLVRQAVSDLFKQVPLTNLNPDEVVALGAALQAEALTSGSDTVLLDVTPLSLGLETMGGIVEKIIHRNTPIPAAIAQEFTTYQDGQDAMIVHVIQGEREFVKDCRSLAQFTLKGIPPMVAGIPRIRVTFALDVDGLLTVSAREMTTGEAQQVEIKPSYGLNEDDLLKILRDNFEHGQSDVEQRLLIEAKVEADQFLSMLLNALEEDVDLLDLQEKNQIQESIEKLKITLNFDNKDDIKTELKTLEKLTHPFAERRINRSIQRALAGQDVNEVMNGEK